MTIVKKSNKQLKGLELEAKRERKQKRIAIASAKNNKENKDFIIETNTSTTIRAANSKERFTNFELELITYVKQLVTRYKDDEFTKVTFRIKDFLNTIGTINNYQHVRDAAKRIQRVQIVMNDSDKKNWTAYSSYFSTVIETGNVSELTITIDPEVLKHLGKQGSKFVSYRANLIYKLKGSYSKIMYPYLKSILGRSQRKNTSTRITIKDLKTLLGIENKYEKFKHLNDAVLKKFVTDINSKTDIFIEYTPEKKGRATHKLLFTIRKQKTTHQDITEVVNTNPATEELKKQGFTDYQTTKMLGIHNDFIPDDEYMAALSDYQYLDEDDMLLIDQKLKRDKISIEKFKEVCVLANRYYKYKHKLGETNKFSAVNIFNKAIKERWDKKDPTEKEINPPPALELTLDQKVNKIAKDDTMRDDFTDFLFDLGSEKARKLMKLIAKQGILQTYMTEPHYFNLVDKFWRIKE